MKTTFLEYYKVILDKVRFDGNLFMKEYRKAMKQLQGNEIDDLNCWLASQGIHPFFPNVPKKEKPFQPYLEAYSKQIS